MKTHSLSKHEEQQLVALIGARTDLVVWDINAIYIVLDNRTVKIEAIAVTPESPQPDVLDEIFPISVSEDLSNPAFQIGGEPGYMYQVLVQHTHIVGVDLVSVGVKFPQEELFHPDVAQPNCGSNIVVCGVVLHLSNGSVLPAYQDHPGFGFDSRPGRRMYSGKELQFSQSYKVASLKPDAA